MIKQFAAQIKVRRKFRAKQRGTHPGHKLRKDDGELQPLDE